MKRFDAWLVNLDPTIGAEVTKTRPAVIVSPDELNKHLKTVIIAPMTTGRTYAWRPVTRLHGKPGVVMTDQIRAVDKQRLIKRVGKLKPAETQAVLEALGQMFAF